MRLIGRSGLRVCLGGGLAVMALAGIVGCGEDPAEVRKQADQYVRKGDDYLDRGDKGKAIAAYTKAVEIDPTYKKPYIGRAMLYEETGRHKEAVSDYTRAIELDPRDAYPYEHRARLLRTVYNDEAGAAADEEKAELIRQKRWSDLQKLRGKE